MAAKLPDLQTLIQAGIDPKTRLPIKAVGADPTFLKENIRKMFEIIDRQDAVRRFTWYNLPEGMDGSLIERILYYKGQAAFFYIPTNDKFYFLPYALDGNIDVYGRYLGITPLPFAGPSATEDPDGNIKPWIKGLVREPLYEIVLPEEITPDMFEKKCVLLFDYVNDISQSILPRFNVNRAIIEAEAECIPFMRTALIGLTGVAGMRVNSEDEQSNVAAAAASIERCALTGVRWAPIVGSVDFQNLNESSTADPNVFMLALNSMDNLRLSSYGLSNEGVFNKQGTILESEAESSNLNTGLVLEDGLRLRQNFCNIVNSLWGLGIWCEITQPAMMQDTMEQGHYEDHSMEGDGDSVPNGDAGAAGGNENAMK